MNTVAPASTRGRRAAGRGTRAQRGTGHAVGDARSRQPGGRHARAGRGHPGPRRRTVRTGDGRGAAPAGRGGGFQGQTALLTPLGPTTGISTLTEVRPCGRGLTCPVGTALLGRVVNALGQPIDGRGPIAAGARAVVRRDPPPPMMRRPIRAGAGDGHPRRRRAADPGEGQRMGVFAPPGTGKSTLLGMLARASEADVIVVALIGERGREVREFIESNLDATRRWNARSWWSPRPTVRRWSGSSRPRWPPPSPSTSATKACACCCWWTR